MALRLHTFHNLIISMLLTFYLLFRMAMISACLVVSFLVSFWLCALAIIFPSFTIIQPTGTSSFSAAFFASFMASSMYFSFSPHLFFLFLIIFMILHFFIISLFYRHVNDLIKLHFTAKRKRKIYYTYFHKIIVLEFEFILEAYWLQMNLIYTIIMIINSKL